MRVKILDSLKYKLQMSESMIEEADFEILDNPQKAIVTLKEQGNIFPNDEILIKVEKSSQSHANEIIVDFITLDLESDAENSDRDGGTIDTDFLEGYQDIEYIKGIVREIQGFGDDSIKFYVDILSGEYTDWKAQDYIK